MPSRILGADVSLTSTGLAVVEFWRGRPALLYAKRVRTTPRQAMPERLAEIGSAAEALAVDYKIDAAGVESGIVHRGRKTTLMLAQARGAVLSGIHQAGCKTILDINPVFAKKRAAGDGHASKDAVHQGVCRLVAGARKAELNEDEADAVAIALAARAILTSS